MPTLKRIDSKAGPITSEELNETMNELLQRFASLFKPHDIDLDYSEDSIKKLEGFIERVRPMKESYKMWMHTIGAYIGSCIIRNFPGNAKWIAKGDEFEFALEFTLNGNTLTFYPVEKALKQLDNGMEDGIWAYYLLIKNLLTDEKTLIEIQANSADNKRKLFVNPETGKIRYEERSGE